jgi:hypothetical protein
MFVPSLSWLIDRFQYRQTCSKMKAFSAPGLGVGWTAVSVRQLPCAAPAVIFVIVSSSSCCSVNASVTSAHGFAFTKYPPAAPAAALRSKLMQSELPFRLIFPPPPPPPPPAAASKRWSARPRSQRWTETFRPPFACCAFEDDWLTSTACGLGSWLICKNRSFLGEFSLCVCPEPVLANVR